MSRHPLLKYCDLNKIDDGLLRDFIARCLWDAALEEIDPCIKKLEDKIIALQGLKILINTDAALKDETS